MSEEGVDMCACGLVMVEKKRFVVDSY